MKTVICLVASISAFGQCICPIKLPIEVVGLDGTSVTVPFDIPSATDVTQPATVVMQIHNLKYDAEASIRFNSSTWIPLSTGTVTLLGNAAAYGGIGGGFTTLSLTVPLLGGTLNPGMGNTVTFRFNGTDGRTSGFRVLSLNIQTAAGANLIDPSRFTVDDPSTWQPPSADPTDVSTGKLLWQSAQLQTSMTGPTTAIKAHCMDCHTQDGRDLKYFNYSNTSIIARSQFHGLTAAQGSQIASYIRSLTTPSPGRPWNPPYQPGPGSDAQPVANWAAGAGLSAVLPSDAAMLPYLVYFAATAYQNPRETPIAFQMPDWNSWLPSVHPMDAFPAFSTSGFNTGYAASRTALAKSYAASLGTLNNWFTATGTFLVPIETNATWTQALRTNVYSAALWQMVKLWEINQEFGLEGQPKVPYGAKANVRGWYGGIPFFTSPNMLHIPAGAGIGNGSAVVLKYLAFAWYQAQTILNDGQGVQGSHSPVDYGYIPGVLRDLNLASNLPQGMLFTFWYMKCLQEETLSGNGPQLPFQEGFHATATVPADFVDANWAPLWKATPSATYTQILTSATMAWFTQVQKYTPAQFYQGGWAVATDDPAKLFFEGTFGGEVWFMLPRLRFFGVNAQLTSSIADWAATIWPSGNWALNKSATCTSALTCTSGY